jgi:hypothetical protein
MSKCKYCGCTDGHACTGGCSWVLPDVCSSCIVTTGRLKKFVEAFLGDPNVEHIEIHMINHKGETDSKFQIISAGRIRRKAK